MSPHRRSQCLSLKLTTRQPPPLQPPAPTHNPQRNRAQNQLEVRRILHSAVAARIQIPARLRDPVQTAQQRGRVNVHCGALEGGGGGGHGGFAGGACAAGVGFVTGGRGGGGFERGGGVGDGAVGGAVEVVEG